jgi:hypothetical protein
MDLRPTRGAAEHHTDHPANHFTPAQDHNEMP